LDSDLFSVPRREIMKNMGSELPQILSKYDELVDWELQNRSAMNVEVAPLRDLLQHLKNPQRQFRTVHIAGTKGKGSVGALIEAGLDRAGVVCGRFSSPHVERITERITFGGEEISEHMLATMMKYAWLAREEAIQRGTPGRNATRFDLETVAAILAFIEARVTWAVVECGLGGRVDSTNVIDGEVCVLTNVGLEHTAILGTSNSAIAFQKVGILKPGATMITGVAPDSAAGKVISEAARKLGCPLVFCSARAGETIAEINTRMAKMVLEEIGRRGVTAPNAKFWKQPIGGWLIDEATRLRACLPGRMEYFELPVADIRTDDRDRKRVLTPVILDGAHVPFNLAAVLHDLGRIRELAGFCAVVFGTGRDKEAFEMLDLLRQSRVDVVICTRSTSGPQPWAPDELRRFAEGLGLAAEDVPEPRDALMRASGFAAGRGWILVTGSFRIVGEVRSMIRKLGVPRRPIPPLLHEPAPALNGGPAPDCCMP
jgi:dihydrofolate synthase / folylpolyglutamate synthase